MSKFRIFIKWINEKYRTIATIPMLMLLAVYTGALARISFNNSDYVNLFLNLTVFCGSIWLMFSYIRDLFHN